VKAPRSRFSWADLTLAEVQAPYRIVEHGRGGKYNRIRILGTYTLSPGPSGTTKVQYTLETEPRLLSDHLLDAFGGRSWSKRKAAKSMRRLRSILEDGRDRGRRATVAGR
jgi:hypothetical protein